MKVHLLSSNHDSAQENKWEVPFDPSLREVTVSLSGPAPQIELSDPFGTNHIYPPLFFSTIIYNIISLHNERKMHFTKKRHCGCVLVPGRVVGEEQGLKELLNIPNSARVVNLKFPRPGAWKLKVLLW